MRLFLREITDHERVLSFDQEEEWVRKAIGEIDEKMEEKQALEEALARRLKPKKRPIAAEFRVRKVDDFYEVAGDTSAQVNLLCSRCATTFAYSCESHFMTFYTKSAELAGLPHTDPLTGKLRGIQHGYARHAHDSSTSYEESDIDVHHLTENFIDLAEVLTQQIQLQIPFQPLCKVDCKGLCLNCGADLNREICTCSLKLKQSPFSSLRNTKARKGPKDKATELKK